MPIREILQPANLLSLSRVFLTPFIGYYLWRGDSDATIIALALVVLAGITDGLDGYVARKLNQVGKLGIALDPVADKVFAGILAILLILYRDFPIWLAAVIIGRDLAIMLVGAIVIRKREVTLPSNLTGKYAFAAIATLLASYVIRFDFGITMMTCFTILFLILSTINYARVFVVVLGGGEVPSFRDRPAFRLSRIIASLTMIVWFFWELYLFVFGA